MAEYLRSRNGRGTIRKKNTYSLHTSKNKLTKKLEMLFVKEAAVAIWIIMFGMRFVQFKTRCQREKTNNLLLSHIPRFQGVIIRHGAPCFDFFLTSRRVEFVTYSQDPCLIFRDRTDRREFSPKGIRPLRWQNLLSSCLLVECKTVRPFANRIFRKNLHFQWVKWSVFPPPLSFFQKNLISHILVTLDVLWHFLLGLVVSIVDLGQISSFWVIIL